MTMEVAVSYGRDLKYFGRLVRENETTMPLQFLERQADGFYVLKQRRVERRACRKTFCIYVKCYCKLERGWSI